MVCKLRHHYMSQQDYGWDARVNHLGRYRCLDQCFALTAGPFPTHMLFDGGHAWRVIQLLSDVLADALKLATARALSGFWFVMNDSAWKLRRQRRTLWFLARLFCSRSRKQCRQLGINSLKWVLSRSSSKLPCSGLICSLRFANRCRLRSAIS